MFNEITGKKIGYHISLICLSIGAVEYQSYCFATNLLHYASLKVTSVLVLFVFFIGIFLVYCYII